MSYLFKISRIDVGQLRLLHIIAKNYKVKPEEIINQLISDYNELHIKDVVKIKGEISIKRIAELLKSRTELEFDEYIHPKKMTAKELKDSQIIPIFGDFNETS